jgi:hypothetical protein
MIIEADDFAGDPTKTGGFAFGGASREQIIKALYKLIEGIADQRVLVQAVELRQEATMDDYAMRYFLLKYAESETPTVPEEGKIQIATYEDFIKHAPQGFGTIGTITREQK